MGSIRQVQKDGFKKLGQNYRNIFKTQMFEEKNGNVTKTDMSSKLKCFQNSNITKIDMSPRLKCHKNRSVTKSEMLLKFY